MVCKFTNSKKAEGLTPNESISNWFDCGDKSIWKINTIKLIPIKAQVTTGFLTVGFSSENGKKTNIYLIETSDSINWSVDTSHVYFFADLTTFVLSTFKALSTALLKSFLSNEPFSPSITISFGPVTSNPAIGVPQARASIKTMPNVSVFEGKTKHAASL